MGQGHAHDVVGKDRRTLAVVLGLSASVLVLQVVGGLVSGSLSLLADAGHVLTDMVGVGLALGAMLIAARPASDRRTYGWYRAEILAAAANALLLTGVAAVVLIDAWGRLASPPEVQSGLMLAVALVGGAANLVALRMLREAQARSLNLRGAYLEVLGDLLGSVAVVVAAVVIALTGILVADVIASVVIAVLILPRAWSLLRDATDILLEATPKGIRLDEVRKHLLGADGVADVHDLHAWTISSGLPVVSAHVVLEPGAEPAAVLDELCRCLSGDFDVEHSTLQLETSDRRRSEERAHA